MTWGDWAKYVAPWIGLALIQARLIFHFLREQRIQQTIERVEKIRTLLGEKLDGPGHS